VLVTIKKLPAHDRWVCIPCRWSVKIPLVEVRVPSRPSYKCTKCAKRMLWTGTAFRPPRRDDDEAWLVAGRILGAGHRFRTTRSRERLPRTLAEVDAWLNSRTRSQVWLGEKTLSVEKGAGGSVRVRSGRRLLTDGEPVLVLHKGVWDEGRLKLYGDGGKPLSSPLVMLPGAPRSVPLDSSARVRLKSR
jgi:hypothetical protein